jgi:RimJ/RimL family protein N-acetyltransferase
MLADDLFATVPVLHTERLDLVPLGPEHLAGTWAVIQDPEAMRLTGTRESFAREHIRDWLGSLASRHDRWDWAVMRREDSAHLGEVVVNDVSPEDESASFRIALDLAHAGRGYGTEATRAVVEHAMVAGLHRLELEVYGFNPRAQRAYERAGFVVEGRRRDALLWDGERVDAIMMSVVAGR